ncbi:methylase [Bordetella ansorpii]|uniref:Methylase n=1 Tax=Bordetella ansorpii TaxID=288768 RepID=A0A157SEP6_9BORD|nr:methyltransferase [Bordetella ansorpii]SAI68918.1 methylase [Bordetella ansorpii]
MLGLSDKSWLVEMLHPQDAAAAQSAGDAPPPREYDAYFGLGYSVRLLDRPPVFKVSLAGLALGAYLVRALDDTMLEGSFLDLGTGSGVHALLLRRLGATHVTGTDLSCEAVMLARENELLNFGDQRITFQESDLFLGLNAPSGQYDTVIFNPPGWRTPSQRLLARLASNADGTDMPVSAMFYGDDVLLKFLEQLPRHLKPGGRAIVGLNSLVGIQDVLGRYRLGHAGKPPLRYRLLERHALPLLYYSASWRAQQGALEAEFRDWRDHALAAYSTDGRGSIYWSYEIVEFQFSER